MSNSPDLGGGMPDMSALLEQAKAMQEQLLSGQTSERFVGVSGGGAVMVEITGGGDFEKVTIRPDAVDPDDVEMLQDLVVAAVNDALRASRALAEEKMAAVTGGLRLPGM